MVGHYETILPKELGRTSEKRTLERSFWVVIFAAGHADRGVGENVVVEMEILLAGSASGGGMRART